MKENEELSKKVKETKENSENIKKKYKWAIRNEKRAWKYFDGSI
jgi:L-fucose isomerase-like protein